MANRRRGKSWVLVSLVPAVSCALATPAPLWAQARIPDSYTNLQVLPEDIGRDDLVGAMQDMLRAVGGGRCSYCHTVSDGLDQPDDDFASDDKPTKRTARAMMRMVAAVNEEHLAGLERRGDPPVQVTCVTCHAGRNRPTTLTQELLWAVEDGGVEALRPRYEALRGEYYGRGTLDFGPGPLVELAIELEESDDPAALAAVDLNLEHHPESVRSWLLKARILERTGDVEGAVAAYERSLEVVPDNPVATRALARIRGGG